MAQYKYTRDESGEITKIEESILQTDGSITNTITEYAYDTDGNLIQTVSEDEHKTYKYNLKGHMISAIVEKYRDKEVNKVAETLTQIVEKTEETYGYDAEGVRIWKETSENKTLYTVDKSLTYTQVLLALKIRIK